MTSFTGTAGDDIFTGDSSNDIAAGGLGNDTLSGAGGSDILVGNGGRDTLNGGDGDDVLFSDDQQPPWNGQGYYSFPSYSTHLVLDRGSDVDTLNGGNGDDKLFGGYGDNIDGGAYSVYGNYLFISFQGASSGVTADFHLNSQTIGGGVITNIQNISWVEGSNFADDINLGTSTSTGYSDSTVVYGMSGNDRITAGYYTSYMSGGDGDDYLNGMPSGYMQIIDGGDGNDTIYSNPNSFAVVYGGAGNDTIYSGGETHGGAGNDLIILQTTYYGGWVYGDNGDDEIRASSVGNSIAGGAGADILTGGAGDDVLYSADRLSQATDPADDMGLEHDSLAGGGGNDLLAIGYGDDADGGSGVDTLRISLGGASAGVTLDTAGIVSGQPFNLGGGTIQNIEILSYLRGSEFNDVLTLATQSTRLTVDAGADDDVIISSNSSVTVYGGAGNDRFVSGLAGDIFDGGAGDDTIDYSNLGAGAKVNLASGTGPGGDQLINVENIVGTAFADSLTGNSGANTIRGGAGADVLTGGGGADTFVFGPGLGAAVITDFSHAGGDRIDVTGFSSIISFSDIRSAMVQSGTDTVISINGGSITLRNTVANALVQADFILGGNHAPTVTASDHTVAANSSTAIASWLTYADADDDIAVTYRFYVEGSGGYLSTSSNAHAATGANIDVAAADLSSVQVHGGPGSNSQLIKVQVYDGQDWGAWTTFTLTTLPPNHAPTVMASAHTVAANSSTAIASWLTVMDADGDAITQYHFWDGGQNGGFFSDTNSAHEPTQTSITVAAADLGGVQVHGGAAAGSQTLWVQAYDGTAWGAWTSFTLTTSPPPVNHAPTASIANQTLAAGSTLALARLITYADADGDAATQYHFWDGGADPNSGYFSDNASTHEAAGVNITVSTANLGSVVLYPGSVGGTETLWVQAYDGQAWSAWSPFTLTSVVPVNHAPTASIASQTLTAGATLNLAGLIAYADADGDAATQYRFWDSGADPTSGYFSDNASTHEAAGVNITVSAANLGSAVLHPGTVSGAETLWVQAYDGKDWGAWSSFTLTTVAPINHAPTVAVSAHTVAAGSSTAISNWLTYADADGDPAVTYQFWDGGQNGGYFSGPFNIPLDAKTNIVVPAYQIATIRVHGGAAGGSQILWVQAYDGKDWGAWTSFTLTTTPPPVNHAPTASIANQTLAAGSTLNVQALISYADADGDAATQYRFWDGGADATSGYFSDNASTHEAADVNITVSAANLGSVVLHPGLVSGAETMWVQAYDGKDWGAWSPFTLTSTVPVNHAPMASIANQTLATGSTLALPGLITYADADGDAATQYRFWDGGADPTSGYFSDNASAREAAGVNITVAAANLGSVVLHPGSVAGTETMWVQAFDGKDWSAWSSFTLTSAVPINHAPTGSIANQTLMAGSTLNVQALISYADADGDAATQYRFWDGGVDASSGYFSDNASTHEAAQTNITVLAANLNSVVLHPASVSGTETMWVQAYDGKDWGPWSSFTLTSVTPVNHLPTASIANQTLAANSAVNVIGLVSYADTDGDPPVQYQFWDSGTDPTSGYFSDAPGSHEPTQANITVAAADLGSFTLHGGSAAGLETMWVRANDDKGWGAWSSFTLTTQAPILPVLSASDHTVAPGTEVPLLALFSATDPGGGALFYDVTDLTPDPVTHGHFSSTITPGHYDMITATAAQMQNETYVAGSTADTISITVWNGGADHVGASAGAVIHLFV